MILPQMGQGSASVEEAMGKEVKVEQTVEATKGAGKKRKVGGRTTSVSIMTRAGVEKMGKGWVVLPADAALLRSLRRSTILNLSLEDILRNVSQNVPEQLRGAFDPVPAEATPKVTKKKRGRRGV